MALKLGSLGICFLTSAIVFSSSLVLHVSSNTTVEEITLRGSWHCTEISKGDILHVLSARSSSSAGADDAICGGDTIVVDDLNDLMVIVNPDELVNATQIAGSFFCKRKWVPSVSVLFVCF